MHVLVQFHLVLVVSYRTGSDSSVTLKLDDICTHLDLYVTSFLKVEAAQVLEHVGCDLTDLNLHG